MAVTSTNYFIISIFLTIVYLNSCSAVKCFDCNSANNSACLDLNLQKMHPIIPIVDCARTAKTSLSESEYFCRKIIQTILHVDKTPEVRVTRGCGWIRHKRQCYKNDNKDHLETVCQCFGDMCNSASTNMALLSTLAPVAMLAVFRST